MIRGFALLIGDLNIFSWNKATRVAVAAGVMLCLPCAGHAQTGNANSGFVGVPTAAATVADSAPASVPMLPALPTQSAADAGLVAPASGASGAKTQSNWQPSADQLVTAKGIVIPAPPPPSALTGDAVDLAARAEQAAVRAQAEAENATDAREAEHNRKSFARAEAGLSPLSPDQIRTFMHKLEENEDASVAPFDGQPKGNVRIINLALDPGAAPPMIDLAANYVTTIDVLDSTGAPWPILDVGIGGSFEVSPTKSGSHVVRVMPLARVANGNLSILLKDLPTPVIFRLSAGGPTVDLRYEVRVPKFGPNAKIPLVNRPPRLEAGDNAILSILENAPPSGAKRLKVGGLDARTMAWDLGGRTYVRTPLTLLSPAWNASVSSADGTTVYEIGDAPVLLMSDNGAVVRARLLRDEEHD